MGGVHSAWLKMACGTTHEEGLASSAAGGPLPCSTPLWLAPGSKEHGAQVLARIATLDSLVSLTAFVSAFATSAFGSALVVLPATGLGSSLPQHRCWHDLTTRLNWIEEAVPNICHEDTLRLAFGFALSLCLFLLLGLAGALQPSGSVNQGFSHGHLP